LESALPSRSVARAGLANCAGTSHGGVRASRDGVTGIRRARLAIITRPVSSQASLHGVTSPYCASVAVVAIRFCRAATSRIVARVLCAFIAYTTTLGSYGTPGGRIASALEALVSWTSFGGFLTSGSIIARIGIAFIAGIANPWDVLTTFHRVATINHAR